MRTPLQHIGADLVVYDNDGKIVLLAEAKSRHGKSDQWAARLRGNMLEHGDLPSAKFFLIATPESIYLWKQERPDPPEAAPDFVIDAVKELKPYFEKFKMSPEDIGPEAFKILILSWLTGLMRPSEQRAREDASSRWLSDSGLAQSLKNARVEMNPA